MPRAPVWFLVAPLPALLCSSCAPQAGADVDKPAAPDLRELEAAYATPTGSFTPERWSQLRDASDAARAVATELGLDDAIRDALFEALAEATGGSAAGSATASSGSSLEDASGYLAITRLCDGWGPAAVADPAHGELRLTVGFTERGVDPVVWGELERCQFVVDGRRVTLRGPATAVAPAEASVGRVRLSFGRSVPFDAITRSPLLFEYVLGAEVDGALSDVHLDYRFLPSAGLIELRLPVEDGTVLVALDGGDELVRVRAKNGVFTCDAEGCSQDDADAP